MAHAFSAAYLFGFQASALCGPAVSMIAREACADMAGFQRRVRSFLHGSYAAPLRFQRDSSAKPMRFRHAFPVDPSQTRRRFDLAGCRRTGFAIGALLGRGFCRRGAVSAVEMLRADPFVFAGGLLALRHVVAPDEARGASACKRGACLRMRPRVVLSGRGPRRMLDDRARPSAPRNAAVRAARSFDFGHETAFWHVRRRFPAVFGMIRIRQFGKPQVVGFILKGVSPVLCQNSVSWPKNSRLSARVQWRRLRLRWVPCCCEGVAVRSGVRSSLGAGHLPKGCSGKAKGGGLTAGGGVPFGGWQTVARCSVREGIEGHL